MLRRVAGHVALVPLPPHMAILLDDRDASTGAGLSISWGPARRAVGT